MVKNMNLKDKLYPTIDPNDPYKLTPEEENLVHYLSASFYQCEKLNKHAELLIHKGSLYLIYNNMMMFHGCIPMTEDGDFREVNVYGKKCKGKELMDELDSYIRKAFLADSKEEKREQISYGIYGMLLILQFSARAEWRHLKDTLLQKRKHGQKLRIHIIPL